MPKQELLSALFSLMERAEKDMKDDAKLAHNSYGAGASWGRFEVLKELHMAIENDSL